MNKKGDIREDGKVFWKYDKRYTNGEYWVTPERYEKFRNIKLKLDRKYYANNKDKFSSDCIIHPWEHGHPESKKTCLWLKNMPPLLPTDIIELPKSGRWENQTASGQNKLGPSPTRWKERSKTYPGIAKAMAKQWG